MSSVPQPYRAADLIMQGTDSLGQGIAAYSADKALDQPGDPALDKYINRLLRGEDPHALAAEAKNDPLLAAALTRIQQGHGGQIVNPSATTPDIGMQGGRPAVLPPGALSPAAGPQGQYGGMGAPPPQAQAPAPQQPAASAPAQGEGLGRPTLGSPATPDHAPPARSGMPGLVNSAAQGFQGAPQFGLGNPPPAVQSAPRQRPMMTTATGPARQPSPQPPPQQDQLRTVRQQQRLMGLLPALAAGQSRQNVADINAQARVDTAQTRQQTALVVQMLKSAGADDQRVQTALTSLEGLDDKQQQAALRGMVAILQSQNAAGSRLGAASISANAKTGSDELKYIQSEINNLQNALSNPKLADIDTGDGVKRSRAQAEQDLFRLKARQAQLTGVQGRDPVQGPIQEFPGQKPNPPPPPAKPPQAQKTTTSVKIRVRLKDGRTGNIDSKDFNPNTMTKL